MDSFKTGYVYDEVMTLHQHNTNPRHPEAPSRITVPYAMLHDAGILEHCVKVTTRDATEEELFRVHTPKHVRDVQAMTSDGKDDVCKIYEQWRTYTCDDTFRSAVRSAGCCLSLVDAICTNQVENGVAIVRPPGHHAEPEESCGFCFFNNVALCARHAQIKHGIKKILIIDWDIHHGNGIQNIFYDEPDVLYISLHRFDNGDYFPSQKDADYTYTGKDKGEGFNVNIPWNRDIMGNVEYKAAFDQIVLPIASQFKPDLILVACGFDAAAADVIGEYILTPEMYAYMTSQLRQVVSGGRIALMLEGGYNPKAIGQCLQACLEVLIWNKPVPSESVVTSGALPCKRALQTIRSVTEIQSRYWSVPLSDTERENKKLHQKSHDLIKEANGKVNVNGI